MHAPVLTLLFVTLVYAIATRLAHASPTPSSTPASPASTASDSSTFAVMQTDQVEVPTDVQQTSNLRNGDDRRLVQYYRTHLTDADMDDVILNPHAFRDVISMRITESNLQVLLDHIGKASFAPREVVITNACTLCVRNFDLAVVHAELALRQFRTSEKVLVFDTSGHSVLWYAYRSGVAQPQSFAQNLRKLLAELNGKLTINDPVDATMRKSMLDVSIAYGHITIARDLIEVGADVDGVPGSCWTPLMTALDNMNYDVAAYLLRHGANPEAACPGGLAVLSMLRSPRMFDLSMNVNEIRTSIKLLLGLFLARGANIDRMHEGFSALHHAAYHGDTIVTQLLLDYGANPNIATSPAGDTPLRIAVHNMHGGVVKSLLLAGARLT